MSNIKGMVAFKMSPLELDEARLSENKITAHQLVATSEKSWEMSGNINLNPMFIQPPPSDDEKHDNGKPIATLSSTETAAIYGFIKHWLGDDREPWELSREIDVDFA